MFTKIIRTMIDPALMKWVDDYMQKLQSDAAERANLITSMTPMNGHFMLADMLR